MAKRMRKILAEGEEVKKDNVKWSEDMDIVLIDALLEQQATSNRIDGTFTTTAYNNVLKICSEELNYPFDKDHLKNRMKTLKTNFNTCDDLFKGLSGFSWSPMTKVFEAETEVWKTLIEAKPNARKWRYTEIKHYDKLQELFAKDKATGEGSMSAKEKDNQWRKEDNSNQVIDVDDTNEVTSNDMESMSMHSNSQTTNASKKLKRKASVVDPLEKHTEHIQSSMNNVADAIREGNAIAEKGIKMLERGQLRTHSEEVYKELLDIGVQDNLQLDAFLFFGKKSFENASVVCDAKKLSL